MSAWLPADPVYSYCRHDRAASLRARRTWPNKITEPSRLFVSDGPSVFVFGVNSGTPEAAALLASLTQRFNDAHRDGPPCRFVPVNRRYWALEPLGEGSPEATAQLWRLMTVTGPQADAERAQIIGAWQRRELDHTNHDEGEP